MTLFEVLEKQPGLKVAIGIDQVEQQPTDN
jgi:hypothetical protein